MTTDWPSDIPDRRAGSEHIASQSISTPPTTSRHTHVALHAMQSAVIPTGTAMASVCLCVRLVKGLRPLPPKICAQSDPPPSEKRRL